MPTPKHIKYTYLPYLTYAKTVSSAVFCHSDYIFCHSKIR